MDPVTVVVTRVVREGSEEAFERAVREFIPRSLAFPGHLGVLMLRPPPGGHEYGAVLRFQSRAAWEAFRDSADYRAFVADLQQHLEAAPKVEAVSGMEAWFAPPGAAVVAVPPLWKQAVVTWVGVNVVTAAITLTLAPLTAGWPWYLSLLALNAVVVAGLTWVVMPVLSRLLRRWLDR